MAPFLGVNSTGDIAISSSHLHYIVNSEGQFTLTELDLNTLESEAIKSFSKDVYPFVSISNTMSREYVVMKLYRERAELASEAWIKPTQQETSKWWIVE